MMEMVVLLFGNKSLSENSLSEMQNAKFTSLRSKPDE